MIPIKKNRNKKGLALIDSTPSRPSSAPSNGPIQVSGSTRSLAQLSSSSTSPLPTSADSRSSYHNKLTEQLANLELGVEFKLDLKEEDLRLVEELGSGNGGSVSKVVHIPTNAVMAKKTVQIATSPATRKQILRELQILHDCSSIYIVSFYGAFLSENLICLCMEFMDCGSLDTIYKKIGPIPEPILSKIALSTISGLAYLYDQHKIMHRDVKPSNILLSTAGLFKICDFGVSGEMINSVADTFVGTSTYMSPERISGEAYTVKSDVWSLGITLIELAIGRFPFSSASSLSNDEFDQEEEFNQDDGTLLAADLPSTRRDGEETLSPGRPDEKSSVLDQAEKKRVEKGGVSLVGSNSQMSILELLQFIVNEPSPALPLYQKLNGKRIQFSEGVREFIGLCLRKEPIGWNVKKKGELSNEIKRPVPSELLVHDWLIEASKSQVDIIEFAKSIPVTN